MADIIGLKGPIIESDAKSEFMNMVAASFDNYVSKAGKVPDSIVYVLGGLGQETSLGWHVTGDSRGYADEVLCKGAAHLLKQTVVR
jgi:hypothetical protein